MRVMILGAGGYLGKKVIQCFLKAEHEVTGVYRTGRETVDIGMINAISAEMDAIAAELQNREYDCIVNCAAVYERQGITLHEVVDANMIFALRVLNCAVECGVKKFITIDTSLPKEFNLYSFTKKQFAEFGEYYTKRYGIAFVNILLEMFYGEDEPDNRFLVSCCKKLLCGEELLLTAGTQKRDIIYIEDVCNAIKLLLEAQLDGFYNVPLGSGEAVPVRSLIEYMHHITESQSELKFGAIPARKNEPDCVADMTILKNMGFELKYPWRDGLRHLCQKIITDTENKGKVLTEG